MPADHAPRPQRLAVIGDPVAHSRSPDLHRAFLARAGLNGAYEALRVPTGEAAAALARLRAEGFTGLNVTTPLKEETFAACAPPDDEDGRLEVALARAAGAANTLLPRGAGWIAANTDGYGAFFALFGPALAAEARATGGATRDRVARAVAAETLLILGTGPTARALLAFLHHPAVNGGTPPRTYLAGRDAARTAALARAMGGSPWADESAALVFSTLPPEASCAAYAAPLRAAARVVDANYGPRSTLAARAGRPVEDGAAMLEAQAKASFALWTRPRTPAFALLVEGVEAPWSLWTTVGSVGG